MMVLIDFPTGYSESMRISRAVWALSLLSVPSLIGACPDATALQFFKHQIAYQRTLESTPFMGLPLIHTDVWVRGPIAGFCVHEQLKFNNPSLRTTYLFGEYGLQGGGSCNVQKNWRQCIGDFAPLENRSDPVTTCKTTIDLSAIPAWRPSPNDQKKQKIADELGREIEARYQDADQIVIRDFNLLDNQITMYVKTPEGDYFQGCGFYANKQPHCEGWHLFGQAPLSRIRKWIFARPYKLK